jgi:ketosteroid isomerase-like protein
LDARWLKAVEARDAKGEAAMFATDGVAYRQHNGPLDRAAYETFEIKFFADNPKSIGAWSTTGIAVAASGDLAVQTGQFSTTGLGPKGVGEDRGNFVTVWKKVNGEWKVAHDISTTSLPEAASLKK